MMGVWRNVLKLGESKKDSAEQRAHFQDLAESSRRWFESDEGLKARVAQLQARCKPRGKAGGKKAVSNGRNGVANGQANRTNGSDGPSTSGGSDSELKGEERFGQVLKELQALKGELKSQVKKYEEAKQVIASHSQALECIQKICREKGWSLSGNSSPEAANPGPSPQERKPTSPVPLIT